MKKFQFLLMFSFLSSIMAFGQNADYQNGVGLTARVINGDLLNDVDFEFGNSILAVDLSYTRNITPWLNVAVPVGAHISLNDLVDEKFIGLHADILAQIGMFDQTRIAAPYLYLGPSFSLSKDFVEDKLNVFEVSARVGIGANFKITDQFLIGLNVGYGNNFEEGNKGVLDAGIGFHYIFGGGGGNKAINIRQLNKKDTDDDGIVDLKDECPTVAGVAAFNGCPDTDGDGIVDYLDKCPADSGTKTTMGCPDKDGDNVSDKDDKCPDVAGDLNYGGCPFIDSDGDKIPDNEDDCPAVKGLTRYRGCPDTDGDGVPDNLDKCKDKVGSAESMGCPDTDGDGIPDGDDKCPTKAGTAELQGCPAGNQADIDILNNASRSIKWSENAFALSTTSKSALDKVVSLLKKNKKYKVTVTGYSDDKTPAAEVGTLSQARADEVKTYMISKGITADRITAQGGNYPKISTRKVIFMLK